MWTHELVFEHMEGGSDTGTVKETLLFEYRQKDFEDADKICEIINYEEWLTGKSFETAVRDGADFLVYLSDKDVDDNLHCYCVQYGAETTKIFEIKPRVGILEE